jgi:hypothetical protein
LELVERALCAGAEVSVLAVAKLERVESYTVEVELAATGTDGGFGAARMMPGPEPSAPRLTLVTGPELERGHVFADPADASHEGPPVWQVALMFLGPALSFAGLLYLAQLAEPLLSRLV